MAQSLDSFARDLRAAAEHAPREAAAVVSKGALNVKTDARANARASSGVHAAKYPDTIGYDLDADGLGAEIGPARSGQGHLGPILENGSINNPPHRDLGRAMDVEEPRFVQAALQVGDRWV